MNEDYIYEILDRAYESDDPAEVAELAERALELDPDNPEALLLKADLIEDDEERLPILERALEVVGRYFGEEGIADSRDDILEDEMGLVYLGLLQRAAFTFFSMGRDDQAMELAEELLRFDHEDRSVAKVLYYRILLEREEWARTAEETAGDPERGLGWAYSKLIASYMLSGEKGKKDKKNGLQMQKMLWDAVRMSPNVPFYMLGYIPDPVDESEPEEDDFHFAMLFEDVWSASRDMLNWFSKAVIIFGLLSGRFGEESGDMEEILDALGGTSDYNELVQLTKNLTDEDDEAILKILSDGGYPR